MRSDVFLFFVVAFLCLAEVAGGANGTTGVAESVAESVAKSVESAKGADGKVFNKTNLTNSTNSKFDTSFDKKNLTKKLEKERRRKILTHSEILSLKDLFTTQKSQNIDKFVLQAIFEDSAKINGQWLTIGESISGYTLVKVLQNSVVLRKNIAKRGANTGENESGGEQEREIFLHINNKNSNFLF